MVAIAKRKKSRTRKIYRAAKRQRTNPSYIYSTRSVQGGRKSFRRTRFARRVQRAVLSIADTKVKYQAYYFGGGATVTRVFNHDTLSACILGGTSTVDTSHPTALGTGTGDNQRIGTDVHTVGFKIRGSFGLPFDRRNTTIKIWLVEYNSNQGSPIDATNWFRNVTGNNLLDPINTERFPGVRLLRTLRAKARDLYIERGELTDSGSIHQLYYDIWVPWRRHLRYFNNALSNPTSGCKETVALIMTCYDTFSAVPTDNVILDHDQMVSFYYKDP